MPKVIFIEHDGTVHSVEATRYASLMQIALDNKVPGIVGDCGGSASCGTCHGYVDAPWDKMLDPPDGIEQSMIDGLDSTEENSRLTCQIRFDTDIDGIRVRLPKSQY